MYLNVVKVTLLITIGILLGGSISKMTKPTPPTIGTVDIVKICSKIIEKSNLKYKVEEVAKKLQDADKETRPKVESLAKEIKNESTSQETKKELENEAQFLLGRLEGIRSQVQKEIETLQINAFKDAYVKAMGVIKDIAKKTNIDLVIRDQEIDSIISGPSTLQSLQRLVEGRPILLRPNNMDLTDQILNYLDTELKTETP